MPTKLFKIKIVNDDGFHIRIAFGSDCIPGKLDVGRRENTGLSVMNVSILNERQSCPCSRKSRRTDGSRYIVPGHNAELAGNRGGYRC